MTTRWKMGCALTALVGCGAEPGSDGATGSAVAAIESVPTSVQCIRLTMRGATRSFDVTGGAAARLDLGPLPSGSMSVTGAAYDVACADINAMTQATWVSDPSSVVVSVGLTTEFGVVMRPNTRVASRVDFVNPARRVFVGGSSSYAVMADGSLRAWGDNAYGQLGDGSTTQRLTPVGVSAPLMPGATFTEVAGGNRHACALTSTGVAFCWGDNSNGQLGIATPGSQSLPYAVYGTLGNPLSRIDAGHFHTCAITAASASPANHVRCWGNNGSGSVGAGSADPTFDAPTATSPTLNASALWASGYTSCALAPDGFIRCWGYNAGALSMSPGNNLQPTIAWPDTAASLAVGSGDVCALRGDGVVLCVNSSVGGAPTPVVGLSSVVQIDAGAGGDHICARRADGTVWCWGAGYYGQLGSGSTAPSVPPSRVIGLSGVVDLAVGDFHSCAVRDDGTIWCWGANSSGQLGDGTTNNAFVPVRVRL